MGECPLTLGERVIGKARWLREGGYLALEASCPMEPGYIYRLELCFQQETKMLGVMLPESGRFRLRKRVPARDEPISARVLRALPGEQPVWPLPFAFSRLTPTEAAALVRDPLFLERCSPRLLAAQEGGLHWVALPLEIGAETPLAPFLTAAAPVETQGKTWALFCFDSDGALRPPPRP
ncbi:MAG: hypothetical protein VB086_03030 [Clostridiaceae bacterium]|nr:hypothetical protein [Clostridiaceae bacterium]